MARNQLTRDKAEVGDLIQTPSGNSFQKALVGTIARTDTAKTLGQLPAGAAIIGVTINGTTASDAATTATITVGFSGGSGHEILNGYDVKTAGTGVGQNTPNGAAFPAVTATKTVTGIYAETGTASTTGGPWTVVIEYV